MAQTGPLGDLRSDKNSLRHDANVLAITGIEADYDGEQIDVDAAVSLLRAAGILVIVYTSPSHAADAPRWRVLCPCSRDLPTDRTRLLDRLNGVLGGVLAGESWTLSQSYYYGSVNRNPSHQVELIDGAPIDHRPDLDGTGQRQAMRTRKAATTNTRPMSSGTATPAVSDKRLEAYRLKVLDNLRSNATEGKKHFALLRCAKALGGIQTAADFTDEAAVQWMMDKLPDSVADWDLAKQTAADGLARGRAAPLVLPDRPARSVEGASAATAAARRAVAKVIFGKIWEQAPQEEIEAAAYAEGERQGLSRSEVCSVARWVVSQSTMQGTA